MRFISGIVVLLVTQNSRVTQRNLYMIGSRINLLEIQKMAIDACLLHLGARTTSLSLACCISDVL